MLIVYVVPFVCFSVYLNNKAFYVCNFAKFLDPRILFCFRSPPDIASFEPPCNLNLMDESITEPEKSNSPIMSPAPASPTVVMTQPDYPEDVISTQPSLHDEIMIIRKKTDAVLSPPSPVEPRTLLEQAKEITNDSDPSAPLVTEVNVNDSESNNQLDSITESQMIREEQLRRKEMEINRLENEGGF